MYRNWMLLCALAMAGCATAGPSEVSVAGLAIQPPAVLLTRRSPRTAYIVVDPGRVPERIEVLVDGVNQGGVLTDLRAFVDRDLKRALGTYFDDVQVVSKGQPLGPAPHVVVDVKIDRVEVGVSFQVETRRLVASSGIAVLTWAMALRPSEGTEYLYSFTGRSSGLVATEPALALRSMFESAIAEFVKGYNDGDIQRRLLAL
jgi:hypothetical protein